MPRGVGLGLLLGFALVTFLGRRLAPMVAGVRMAEVIGSGDLTGQALALSQVLGDLPPSFPRPWW